MPSNSSNDSGGGRYNVSRRSCSGSPGAPPVTCTTSKRSRTNITEPAASARNDQCSAKGHPACKVGPSASQGRVEASLVSSDGSLEDTDTRSAPPSSSPHARHQTAASVPPNGQSTSCPLNSWKSSSAAPLCSLATA